MARQTFSSCKNGVPVRVRKGDETIEITLVDKVAELANSAIVSLHLCIQRK
jgi:hypothetical protein